VIVRAQRLTLVAVVALALLASAAGCNVRGSGFQYLRSRSTGTYVKLPATWHVGAPKDQGGLPFVRVMDANPKGPAVLHLVDDVPSGFVRVRNLSAAERDAFSFASLRQELNLNIDQASKDGLLDVLQAQDLSPPGGFRGQRLVFTLRSSDGISPDVTISQTTIVNAKTTRVHVLVVGCTAVCFHRNQSQIDTIAKSLTVKEP
jgi:hypothetical protein